MSPFSSDDARARGISRRQLHRAAANGQVCRLFRRVYIDADEPDTLETRAAAIALIRPSTTVTYLRSAAWLYGVDTLPPGETMADWPLQLAVPSGQTPPRIRGCQGFEAPALGPDSTHVLGATVSTPLRTALDCGRLLPPLEAVAAVDQFLHRDPSLHGPFLERIADFAGRRGKRQLDFVGRVADPRVESPGESWTRAALVDAGFPVPEPQIEICNPDTGWVIARLDNGYRRHQVAVEYDGQEHHDSVDQIRHDRERRSRLRTYGWRVVVVRREHVWRDHRTLLDATLTALCERGFDRQLLTEPGGLIVDRRVLEAPRARRAA